eukprot:scaffold15321_cov116-Isochrysis_galbana.AAC.6
MAGGLRTCARRRRGQGEEGQGGKGRSYSLAVGSRLSHRNEIGCKGSRGRPCARRGRATRIPLVGARFESVRCDPAGTPAVILGLGTSRTRGTGRQVYRVVARPPASAHEAQQLLYRGEHLCWGGVRDASSVDRSGCKLLNELGTHARFVGRVGRGAGLGLLPALEQRNDFANDDERRRLEACRLHRGSEVAQAGINHALSAGRAVLNSHRRRGARQAGRHEPVRELRQRREAHVHHQRLRRVGQHLPLVPLGDRG